jgi:hypothetical protein
MAIPNEICGVRVAAAYFLARTFIYLLGLGAIAWGGLVLPLFWRQAPLDAVASGLAQGNSFKIQMLLDEAQQVETSEPFSFCNPTKLHNAVVLRLAIPDDAIAAAQQTTIDSAHTSFNDLTRGALACAPTDSFGWLTLFYLGAGKSGLTPENANYLRLSYALGPNEGWIALWRVRLALALFERLPSNLSNDAIEEFVKLVDTGRLYPETAKIFASSTPAAQSRIVDELKRTNSIPRQIFARVLYERGVDLKSLNFEVPDLRPWQK